MQEHLQEKAEELMEHGLSREDAMHRARREFGNAALIEECSREVWQWPRLESVWRDGKHAVRQLQHSSGFTATVILTLALSIGAQYSDLFDCERPPAEEPSVRSSGTFGDNLYAALGSGSSDARRNIDGEQWELLAARCALTDPRYFRSTHFGGEPRSRLPCAICS